MMDSEYLKRKLTFLSRSNRKRKTLKKVLALPYQQNNDVVNVHRLDPNNAGDFYCAPHHYFDVLKGKALDIFDYKKNDVVIRNNWVEKIGDNSLIIGGGGLLNLSAFNKQLKLFEKLKEKGKKTVIWGAGHNSIYKTKLTNYNIDHKKFGLVGTRDYGMNVEWVPCASCLHPIFDKNFEVINEIGAVLHRKNINNSKTLNVFKDYPIITNNSKFENMIQFIGESDIILTDSYHGMYWAILLEKKVIAFPTTSKFYDFKYSPITTSMNNFKNEIKNVSAFTGVLEECREINMKFSEKVFNYLGV